MELTSSYRRVRHPDAPIAYVLILAALYLFLGVIFEVSLPYQDRVMIAQDSALVLDIGDAGTGRLESAGDRRRTYRLIDFRGFPAFDFAANGDAAPVEWLKGTSSILVDRKAVGSGAPLDGRSLISNASPYGDAFINLARFDLDGDGQIAGRELDALAVWRDNGNALLENGELMALSQFSVVSIETRSKWDGKWRGHVVGRFADGGGFTIDNVWFANSARMLDFERRYMETPITTNRWVALWCAIF